MPQHFKIIIPVYNAEKYIGKCLESVRRQTYKGYEVVVINDASTDSTMDAILPYLHMEDFKCSLISNSQNMGACANFVAGVSASNPQDEDVICMLDGDDWLATPSALDIVADAYGSDEKPLMTYGQFKMSSGQVGWCRDFPPEVVEKRLYRVSPWVSSHMRTCKYKLWKLLTKEMLTDSSGQYFGVGCDVAIMLPLLEMSGGRHKCIDSVIYVYNTENPLSDFRIKNGRQRAVEAEIRSRHVLEARF